MRKLSPPQPRGVPESNRWCFDTKSHASPPRRGCGDRASALRRYSSRGRRMTCSRLCRCLEELRHKQELALDARAGRAGAGVKVGTEPRIRSRNRRQGAAHARYGKKLDRYRARSVGEMPVVDAQARIVAAEAMTNGRGVTGPKGSISGASTYKPPRSKGSARGVLTDHTKHRRRLRMRISRCCTRWRRPSGVTPSVDIAARRPGTSPSVGVGTDELVWRTSVSRSWAPAWSLHDRAVPRPTTAPARSPSSHGATAIRPRARHVQRTSELLRGGRPRVRRRAQVQVGAVGPRPT